MKKIALLVLAAICTISFCMHVSATDFNSNIITIGKTNVIFDTYSTLTNEEKQLIAEYIVYGPSDTQTYGLICNLFGHKNTTEIVTTITHCVSATVPRCLDECWEIITCSRCGYTESTRLSFSYINCCP